ncbi:MAG: class I SAM-dependent methyltransferase [Nitriliruptoraceae bacterium]
MEIDQAKLEEFLQTLTIDAAAGQSAVCGYLGDALGLYAAMADAGPLTAAELARRTDTHERYIREWLSNQAAGGYVTYDPGSDTFELPSEQAAVLADPDSPTYLPGVFEITKAMWAASDRLVEAFRTGDGVGWEEHDPVLYRGVERLFGPMYRSQLVEQWLPSLDGVEPRLQQGARVADVGCGHGASTIAMARAYPASRFIGYDYHPPSIAAASKAAAEAGVGDRAAFEIAEADGLPGDDFDLICLFDCFHDMGDPVKVAAHLREKLADEGTMLLVEPMAGDELTDNLHPVGRLAYAVSTVVCTPSSLAQPGGMSLGGQAGQARLTEVLDQGGFDHVRRVATTPFNLVLEVRP